jgi:hypothetical protein
MSPRAELPAGSHVVIAWNFLFYPVSWQPPRARGNPTRALVGTRAHTRAKAASQPQSSGFVHVLTDTIPRYSPFEAPEGGCNTGGEHVDGAHYFDQSAWMTRRRSHGSHDAESLLRKMLDHLG